MRRFYRRNCAWILGATGIAAFLTLWEVGGRTGVLNPFFFSRPSQVVTVLAAQFASGQMSADLAVSLRELLKGFLGASLLGIPLGVLMARVRWFEAMADPYIWFFYSAPLVAFYPIFIMVFGLGEGTVVAITFLLAFFPVVVNTIAGVQHVDPVLLRVARSFGANELDLIWKVIFPSALPIIIAGLRLAAGRALLGVIVGEFFGANAGLGFRIALLGQRVKLTEVYGPVAMVALMGVVLTQGLRLLENRIGRWYTH